MKLTDDAVAIVAANLTVAHFDLMRNKIEKPPQNGNQAMEKINQVYVSYIEAVQRGQAILNSE